jgi:diacylglycerol O-acyltransferase / wax synthase
MARGRFDDRMSDEDALMWNIEKDPILRSTIVAVALLDRAPDMGRLRTRLAHACGAIPRLHQTVVSPPLRVTTPFWIDEPKFDLGYHLRHVVLPAPGSMRHLLDAVAPIAADAFDRARPLWQFTVVDGLTGGRAAVVLKVHHSVTDGVGGMELLARMIDLERDPVGEVDGSAPAPAPDVSRLDVLRDAISQSTADTLRLGVALPRALTDSALDVVRDPVGTASRAVETAGSIARTLAPATEPMSPLMRARSLGRHLDVFDVPTDDLRRAAKEWECSLNDAFMSAVTGGLGRYHQRHGHEIEQLRVTMPINLRTGADGPAGNRFAPARFAVPARVNDPVGRMQEIRALVRGWRSEPALALTGPLAAVLNRLPTSTSTALFGSMLKGVDFVATNVPGAPVPVFAAGAAIERFYALAPPSGAAVNVALVSHVDTCCIGVVVDTAAVPDPDNLVHDLRAGFDEVLSLS